jgi:hypothetical protein
MLVGLSVWSYDHAFAGYFVDCAGSMFQNLGKRTRVSSLTKFGDEVKRDGMKRFLIKDLPKIETPPDTKLLGTLRRTERSTQPWFWRHFHDLNQFVPRQVTRAVYGKSYDFIPFTRLYDRVERLVLPNGKTLNTGWKLAGAFGIGYVTYPYTFAPLLDRVLTWQEQKKLNQSLDDLVEQDYRFREIKDQKISRTEARRRALDLRARYEAYFAASKGLHEQGIEYTDPEATVAIFSDRELLEQVGPLIEDVINLPDPKFYADKPYLDATDLKKKDAKLVHELMKQNHLKIMLETSSYNAFVKDGQGISPQVMAFYRKDPFYRTLTERVKAKQVTPEKAAYAYDQKLDWATRLKMFETVGVTPYRIDEQNRITTDTLKLPEIEKEILRQAQ